MPVALEEESLAPLMPLLSVFDKEVFQQGLRQAFEEGGQQVLKRKFGTTELTLSWAISTSSHAKILRAKMRDRVHGVEIDFLGGRLLDDPFRSFGRCSDGYIEAIETVVRELVGNYQKANPAAPQS